ncbi:MAG: RNA 3'-phosphate cyclase [Syntrophobacterales bacterium]|nr:MAG: RNA 3'-phosphate cyclase [Syntrophobacterales bacterium]
MTVTIDGSYGEGGGQILRTALGLSALLGRDVEIERIRAGREKPGLRPQHLAGIRALARIAGAKVEGDEIGSQSLSFSPNKVRGGVYRFNVAEERGSAGAVTLVLQVILLPLCFSSSSSEVTLLGGTHVPWSPPFHYLSMVLLPTLVRMGFCCEAEIDKWGWYPKGGGVVRVKIVPVGEVQSIDLSTRGRPRRIFGISGISNLPAHIALRQKERARQRIKERLRLVPDIQIMDNAPSPGQGTVLFLVLESEGGLSGFTALGRRGKRAEEVADEAVQQLIGHINSEGCIDPHLSDQVIPFAALAKGKSVFTTSRITRHLLTNIWVVKQFLDVWVEVEGGEGEAGRVEIHP